MDHRSRARRLLCATTALVLFALAAPSYAQILPGPEPDPTPAPAPTTTTTTTTSPSTTTTTTASTTSTTEAALLTTTTTAPSTTTTTAPGDGDGGDPLIGSDESTPAPEGAEEPEDGDGATDPSAGTRSVPPEAQAIIDGVRRTPSSSSAALLEATDQLVELGLSRDEAIRLGFGRFPIAGLARYSHDWLFPRYGPGFRFHLGTDVFADFGTPLRSPVDGTVTAGNGGLGGLYTKIHMDDGTYFYYAHMSGLVDGFVDGMAVKTGDIVGYVGDSGNAKGTPPHLHIGVYPQGGPAVDPKPILDGFLADALAQLPEIVEQVRADRPVATAGGAPVADLVRTPRPLLSTALLRPFTDGVAGSAVPTEVLYQTTANPSSGGLAVAESEAERMAASIDWEAWAARNQTEQAMLERAEQVLRLALGPFTGIGSGSAHTAAG